MKTSTLLVSIASVTTAVFPLSLAIGLSTTVAVMALVTSWTLVALVSEYGRSERSSVRRLNAAMATAASVCCRKSALRLAA